MTKKKEEIVPPVKEKSEREEAPAAAPAEEQAAVPVLIEIPQIDPEMEKLAKKWGIPLDKFVQMGERINLFFADYAQFKSEVMKELPNLPQRTIDLLKAEAEKQRAAAMQTAAIQTGATTGGLGGIGNLLPLIAQFAGSGSSPISDELTKQIIDAGLKQMFAGTRLLEAIQTKVMADIGGKAITESLQK